MPEVILEAKDLVKHYPIKTGIMRRTTGHVKAVDGVSFELHRGETLGIVGESGCGKSTLGRLIMRLEEPTAGEVVFEGLEMQKASTGDMRKLRRDIQIVFQDPYTSLNPRMTVGDINGNALCMAAAEAVDELCTHEALAAAEQVNLGALEAIDTVIDEYELPAHTVGVGLKGCVTWSTTPVRNYRDYKATDFGVAELSWLWGVNRGILTPPGLDEQWLVSLAHTTTDMDQLVGDVRELAKALRG